MLKYKIPQIVTLTPFFLYHFCMINSQICKWRMTVYPYICALDIMEIQLILML